MNWDNLSKSNKIFLMILPSLVIIALFVSFYLLPTMETLNKLKTENEAIKTDIDKAQRLATKYEEIKALNAKLQAKMQMLQSYLPKEKEVSDVLKKISEIGLKKGLTITLWRPKEKSIHSSQEIYEIPVDVSMNGKYHIFGEFFADITKIERIINIKKMDIKKGDRDPTLLNISMVAATYSLIPEEEKKQQKEKKK